jgi:hypothetical protein
LSMVLTSFLAFLVTNKLSINLEKGEQT